MASTPWTPPLEPRGGAVKTPVHDEEKQYQSFPTVMEAYQNLKQRYLKYLYLAGQMKNYADGSTSKTSSAEVPIPIASSCES